VSSTPAGPVGQTARVRKKRSARLEKRGARLEKKFEKDARSKKEMQGLKKCGPLWPIVPIYIALQ
jgi:hypothetical protein